MNSILFVCMALLLHPQVSGPATPTTPDKGAYLKEASISQTESAIHVSANSPRPMAQTLDALLRKYGWRIEYEDPQYTSKLDMVERPSPHGDSRAFPAGGAFSVDIPSGSATAAPPEDKTLQVIVDSYNRSGNPGRFELRKIDSGKGYAVVGVAAQDAKGKVAEQKAVLDARITVPTLKRSADETVNLICQKIGLSSHVPITLGVNPRALLVENSLKFGGTNKPARDLLSDFLSQLETLTKHPMYWRLLFDPSSQGYYLDIHALAKTA
jgi:hypothetical protein